MIRTRDLFSSFPEYLERVARECEYPWRLLDALPALVERLVREGIDGFSELAPGVLVGEGVTVAEGASIAPPAVIGRGTEIRHGAFLRGYVITGEGCVIGNSSEVKGSILLAHVQIPHYNYVGDSVLGNFAHLGAGAVLSNLKLEGGEVTVRAEREYPTGRRKLGAILGDGANVGCGAVLNPGTVICKGSVVYPLTSVRGTVPEGRIVKSSAEWVKKTE